MSAPDQETKNGQPAFDQAIEDGRVTIYPTDVTDEELRERWVTADVNDSVSVVNMR